MLAPYYSPTRPASITALTILEIIAGLIDILVGLLMVLAFRDPNSFAASFIGIPSSYSFFIAPIGVAWFTLGVLALIVSVFLWKGKGWAWLFSFILATDAIVLGGFGLLLGSLAVALPVAVCGLIMIFLCLTPVRAYCGRTYMPGPFVFPPVAAPRVMTQPTQMTAPVFSPTQFVPFAQQPYAPRPSAPVQQTSWTVWTCPSCGSSLQSDSNFCLRCGTRLR